MQYGKQFFLNGAQKALKLEKSPTKRLIEGNSGSAAADTGGRADGEPRHKKRKRCDTDTDEAPPKRQNSCCYNARQEAREDSGAQNNDKGRQDNGRSLKLHDGERL